MVNSKFLGELEKTLAQYPVLAGLRISIRALPELKKDAYWGSSTLRYVTDGAEKFGTEGAIGINLRDATSVNKVLETVAHEASHLTGDKVPAEDILRFLRSSLEGKAGDIIDRPI